LLHSERESHLRFDERQFDAEAGGGGAVELAEALDNRRIAGLHGE
jgi:hypothetical protein